MLEFLVNIGDQHEGGEVVGLAHEVVQPVQGLLVLVGCHIQLGQQEVGLAEIRAEFEGLAQGSLGLFDLG